MKMTMFLFVCVFSVINKVYHRGFCQNWFTEHPQDQGMQWSVRLIVGVALCSIAV